MCTISILFKTDKKSYHILSRDESKKLSEFNHTKLYAIKIKNECNCELSRYNDYLKYYKIDLIKRLKNSEEKIAELEDNLKLVKREKNEEILKLKKEIQKIKKVEKSANFKDSNFEDFYDTVIDINTIKDLKQGWEVTFNQKGKKNYEQFKDEGLIKVGVIGNIYKGKSFILSQIAKVNLLTG